MADVSLDDYIQKKNFTVKIRYYIRRSARLCVPVELYLLFVFPYISTTVPKWFLFHFCRHLKKNLISIIDF